MKKMSLLSSLLMFYSCYLSGATYSIPYGSIPQHEPEGLSPRTSSFPYIAGDTFRAVCDFHIDEKRIPFDPEKVEDGDTIFLSGWALEFFFFVIHPKIKRHYILVTHNSDAPSPGKFEQYLENEKLIAWFGANSSVMHHPKFFPIPVGLPNLYWPHGDILRIHQERQRGFSTTRDIYVYMNFNPNTNMKERGPVWHYFKDKSFCYSCEPNKSQDNYLQDLTRSYFVVSPPGNGLDCYRHWEALLMSAIPIVKHSTLDPLFEGLPVLLIDDWHEVTLDFLQTAYVRIRGQEFLHERLFAPYWLNKIHEVKSLTKQRYSA